MNRKITAFLLFLAVFSLAFHAMPEVCEARNTAEKLLPGKISAQMETDRKTYREEEPIDITYSIRNGGYYPIRIRAITWKMTNGLVITERPEGSVDGIIIDSDESWTYRLSVYGSPDAFGHRIPVWYTVMIIVADCLLVTGALVAIAYVKRRERRGILAGVVCLLLVLTCLFTLPEQAQASDSAKGSRYRWARKKSDMIVKQLPGLERMPDSDIKYHIGYLLVSVPYAGKTVKVRAEVSYEILE